MPAPVKCREDRVADLEAIYLDMPDILNTRFERVNLHLNELSSRLDLLDRQLSALIRDMRDMRGGVTRQLVEQDKRLASVEERLGSLDRRFGALDERLEALEAGQAQLRQDLQKVEQEVSKRLDEILRRLPG